MKETAAILIFSISIFFFISLLTPWGHEFMYPPLAKFIVGFMLAGYIAGSAFFLVAESHRYWYVTNK